MPRKNLFNNLKDYNNELEKILEKKEFSQEVKNLLLSMLYKIEVSYSDYKKTKVNVVEKEYYLKRIIENIKECKKIELVKDKEIEIDYGKKSIQVKQNEKLCLQAILMLSQKEIEINKKNELVEKPLKEFFKTASIINKMEVIRDFDGWTWFKDLSNTQSIEYNFIYQCLNIAVGCENLDKIERNASEKFDLIQAITYVLEKYYGKKIAHNLVNNFVIAISKIYYEKNKDELEDLIEKSGKLKEKRKSTVDTKQILNEISTEKKQNLKKLDEIEKALKDRKLLEEEFIKRNERGETYFSINTLINILEREKEKILVRNEEIDDLRNPGKYANETRKIEEEIQFIEEIQNTNFEKEVNEIINIMVEIFEIKLEKAENKKEIIKLIYEIRYFILLEYNKNNQKIYENEICKNNLFAYINKLIIKAINIKALNSIFNDNKKDIEIYEDILKLKIIDLENIEYIINNENESYKIQIYDSESLEYEKEIKLLTIKGVKINKKMKSFN